ncbi:hypothetical protein [Pseudomonas koreensis]|uniref:hypothetical protein n=1 Tax=Pseudomonas koreensis TaxID=198620 RepID=UPI0032087F12
MRAGGASAEEVAKYAYGARNELKVKYREYTPPDMLDVIDARIWSDMVTKLDLHLMIWLKRENF